MPASQQKAITLLELPVKSRIAFHKFTMTTQSSLQATWWESHVVSPRKFGKCIAELLLNQSCLQ